MGERVGLIMRKILSRCGIILFLGFVIFAMLALVPVQEPDLGDEGQLQKDVIRFHVVAKSNQHIDQELKLVVRDAVLEYLRPSLEGAQDQKEAAAILQKELPQIKDVAVRTLRSQGCNDQVQVCYGTFHFPVRVYGPLTFPEGKYQSLRIVLGEGEGRNWWCCLFPPLCYVDLATSAQQLQEENKQDSDLSQFPDKEGTGKEQMEKILLIDSVSETDEKPHLTTKIGEWLEESQDRSLLSWFWSRRS